MTTVPAEKPLKRTVSRASADDPAMTAALKNTKAPTQRIRALKTPSPTMYQMFPMPFIGPWTAIPVKIVLTGSCPARETAEFRLLGSVAVVSPPDAYIVYVGDNLIECDNNDSTYR